MPRMAEIEVISSQRGIASVWVTIDKITDAEVEAARAELDRLLDSGCQVSDAIANAFVHVVRRCPAANPSDLWQHVIYRHTLALGWADQRWKRVSGFALERALVSLYQERLLPQGVRLRIVKAEEANRLLAKVGVTEAKATKVDLFIEGCRDGRWQVFGAAHVKSSIAERIQDDVPASLAFMQRGLLSVAITMDSKSYPPPHGIGINYGELGGRSFDVGKDRLKRNYIEAAGQFDGLFSYNLRTPPSPEKTASGKRIYTLSFAEAKDPLVALLAARWAAHPNAITP